MLMLLPIYNSINNKRTSLPKVEFTQKNKITLDDANYKYIY